MRLPARFYPLLALIYGMPGFGMPLPAHATTWQVSSLTVQPAATAPLPFTTALAQAWQLDPNRTMLTTNRKGAEARARAAGSWFAGGPSLNGSYFDDHAIGSNEGYTTYQGEVSVPLWLPGQGSATKAVAQAEANTAEKRAGMAHMALAVNLLGATSAALLAQKRVATTHTYYTSTAQICADVTRATTAGETTQADLQQATATQEAALADNTAAREEAQTTAATLEALLGSPAIPDIENFSATESALNTLSSLPTLESNDPRLQAAKTESAAAQAALKLARRSFMPNPEIGVGAIHEKQYGSPWDNRVGISFTMPLPSSVHNAPLLSAAKDRVAAADQQEILTRRMIKQEAAQIRAQLIAATQSLKATKIAATNLLNRATLLERSWKLRETPFDDVARARQMAYTARLAQDKAEIAWHTAIVRALIASQTLPGLSTLQASTAPTRAPALAIPAALDSLETQTPAP